MSAVPGYELRGRVVGPGHVLDDAIVTIRSGVIESVLTPHEWRSTHYRAQLPAFRGTLLPGLVDLHADESPDPHYASGATSIVVNIARAPLSVMLESIARIYPLALTGDIAGISVDATGLSLDAVQTIVEHGEGTVCIVDLDQRDNDVVQFLDSSRVSIAAAEPACTAPLEWVRAHARDLGLAAAVRAMSIEPARTAGIDRYVGAISPGLRADILIVDDALNLRQVMRDGIWATESRRGHHAAAV